MKGTVQKSKNQFFGFGFLIVFLVFFIGCSKQEEDKPDPVTLDLPQVTTNQITVIDSITLDAHGKVISDGGSMITTRGFCWSTHPDPTLADSVITVGSGTGEFSFLFNNIVIDQMYYFRAFATNTVGTVYGDQRAVKTITHVMGSGTIDIDGNSYPTVYIGSQEWTASNLRTTRFNNGDLIPEIVDANAWWIADSAGLCSIFNDVQNDVPYGKLYNGWVVTDSRNVCPLGFHVPSDSDWTVLLDYTYDMNYLREEGTLHWIEPNVNANNLSGFTALPTGVRTFPYPAALDYYFFGHAAYFWSSTRALNLEVKYWFMNDNSPYITRHSTDEQNGLSVRCVRD